MYQPSEEILEKYADVLVNFALNNCKGIKKGDVVLVSVPECAKPILLPILKEIAKAGGKSIISFTPDGISRELYEIRNDEQLSFFPDKYLKGRIDQIDHSISIIADADPHELEGVDSKKIMLRQKAYRPYMEWRDEKENRGEFTWTLALYGTEAMAKEAGLSLEEYWDEIIKACYLDKEDPKEKWKESVSEVERVKDKLNSLEIEKVRVEAEGTDIFIGLGENRKWLGGSGANIPSFEVFISPDFRKTEGKIKFTEPLYMYGNLIENVYLEFENGRVVKATAEKGEGVLKEMIAVEGADRIGEFSLTDSRLSRISKFMATTLFDENVGKEFGNTHLALGKSYKNSFTGDPKDVTKGQWNEMGFNESAVHTDIVATSNRKVTAYLKNGEEKVIYENGKFTI